MLAFGTWMLFSSPLKKIIACVLGAHVILLLSLCVSSHEKTPLNTKYKIQVHTHTDVQGAPIHAQKAVSSPPTEPIVKAAPSAPKVTKTKTTPSPAPSPKAELLQNAKNALSKISEKQNTLTSGASSSLALEKVETLQVDVTAPSESDYKTLFTRHLQLFLRLPEKAKVHLQVTLNQEGKVIAVEQIKSESLQNQIYVEKNLKLITFPPFGNRLDKKTEITFSLTLEPEKWSA